MLIIRINFYQIKVITTSLQILNDDIKNYDESIQINHNPNWSYLTGHPNRILIISSSGSGKTNVLLNLIKHQWPDIDEIYSFFKDSFESK